MNLLEKEDDENLSSSENRIVVLLLVLVSDYEEQNVVLPTSTPLDILTYLVEANDLKQTDLISIIGSSDVVAGIVNGKRKISKAQAHSLSNRFNVSYRLFL